MKIYGRSLSQAVRLWEINSIYEYYLNTLNNYLWLYVNSYSYVCALMIIYNFHCFSFHLFLEGLRFIREEKLKEGASKWNKFKI